MRLGGRCGATRAAAVLCASIAVTAASTPAAEAAETFFQLDLRAGGLYGAVGNTQAVAFMGGIHLGGVTWFGDEPLVGLLYTGGAEVGPEFTPGKLTGAVGLSTAIGPVFLLSGKPKDGTMISLGWAPRLLVNFTGAEVASPFGAELAINAALFKFPLWFVRTLDGATFFGLSLGVEFMR